MRSRSFISRSRSAAACSYCCVLDRLILLAQHRLQPAHRLFEVQRSQRTLHAHAAGGLVDQVNRLIRQEAVGDIAAAHLGGGAQGVVGDRQPVVLLIAVAQPLEDLEGLLDGGLAHDHFLEAPLQRRVLLDVLAILIERGRADALQLAARERRLEDIRGVHRALGRARADQRMHLIDEDDAVLAGANLLDDLLQPLFKLAAILGAGDQRADVQRQQALARQRLGHLARDDLLRQPLDDGRLANARLANQRRIVLLAARENLDDALDLLLAPDHWVELAHARVCRQVNAHLVDGRRLGVLLAARLRAALPDCDKTWMVWVRTFSRLTPRLSSTPAAMPSPSRTSPKQQMLGADVVMVQPPRLIDRQLDHLLGARGQPDLAQHDPVAAPDDELDGAAHFVAARRRGC